MGGEDVSLDIAVAEHCDAYWPSERFDAVDSVVERIHALPFAPAHIVDTFQSLATGVDARVLDESVVGVGCRAVEHVAKHIDIA